MLNKDLLSEDNLDFNFWPSFTDLMLSVALIMSALLIVKFGASAVELKIKQDSNKAIVAEIKEQLQNKYSNFNVKEISNEIFINNGISKILKIKNENDYQQISFYENILFEQGRSQIVESGKDVLKIVGTALGHKSTRIRLIQIEGHTDIVPIRLTNVPEKIGNIKLGSDRAISVYKYFMDEVGLDPANVLMSATSFGEFMPTTRKDDSSFSEKDLSLANYGKERKASNRRIELRIFFSARK